MMRRLTFVLSFALVAAAGAAPARTASDARGRLHGAEARYRRHLVKERPDLASRLGWGGDAALAPITQATIARDGAWLRAFAESLATIARADLDRRDAVALDSLDARVERERAPFRAGAWTLEPLVYLETGPLAALESASASGVPPCERARRAARRLNALPEVLRAAEVNLGEARDFDRSRARAAWGAARDSLRWALPAKVAGCRESERDADLVEADTLALGAVDRFVRFLDEDLARAGPDSSSGSRP